MVPRAKVAGLVGFCLAVVVCALPASAGSSRPGVPVTQASGGHSYIGPAVRNDHHGHWSARVCGPPAHAAADCNALVVTNSDGTPLASAIWLNHAGHVSQRCRGCPPRACTGACTRNSSEQTTDEYDPA